MFKISLVTKYIKTKEVYCKELLYSIKDDILYYKDKKLCILNYYSVIHLNSLYIYRSNIIEEYAIKRIKEKKKEESCKFEILFKHVNYKEVNRNREYIEESNTLDKEIFRSVNNQFYFEGYRFVYSIGKMNMYYNEESKLVNTINIPYETLSSTRKSKFRIFINDQRIHLAYEECLITLPTDDIIYKFKIIRDKENVRDVIYKSINNKSKSIYKMVCFMALYKEIYINVLHKEVEGLLYELSTFHKSFKVYFDKVDDRIRASLCRKLEDKELFNFEFDKLSIKDMKKVVLMKEEYVYKYIDKCISKKREYEILGIINILRRSAMIIDILKYLLKRNCFYLISQVVPYKINYIGKIEKCNTKSQRNIVKWQRRVNSDKNL